MISICKIFRFEAAHAIHHYPGKCAHIHGHSYELHVTIQAKQPVDHFIGGMGIFIDFKELKALVHDAVINTLDHRLILSKASLSETKNQFLPNELVVFDVEPAAENLLLFLSKQIISVLPEPVRLHSLKL